MKYLEDFELTNINGGSFAYDVGAVLGFIWRTTMDPVGLPYAVTVWNIQYSK